MREISSIVFLLIATLAGSSAAGAAPRAQEQSKKGPGADAAKMAGTVDAKSYQIGADDVLNIRVWREPELSGQFVVRPDGRVSLPLVGEIQASGVTPEALSGDIAKGLGKYMTQPEVSVSVQQVNSKKYFIIGEVNKPGSYPLTVPTTILEALVNAGGFRDFANPKKIIVLRKDQRLRFNYKEVIAGKKLEQNVRLENGDQIIVP